MANRSLTMAVLVATACYSVPTGCESKSEVASHPQPTEMRRATLGDGTEIEFEDEAIVLVDEPMTEDFDASEMASPQFSQSAIAARLGIPADDVFTGTARRAAKLSVATGAEETFSSVQSLRSSLLTDAAVKAKQPPLKDSAKTGRRDFEKRNVRVTAWLYAAKKSDDDNDYHLVIGTNPNNSTRKLMTVEISGISDEFGHSSDLIEARRQWKTMMGNALPGEGSYRKYMPPIKVMVEGSVFYDWTHRNHIGTNSEPGPAAFKPGTAWEIHPVTGIERLN